MFHTKNNRSRNFAIISIINSRGHPEGTLSRLAISVVKPRGTRAFGRPNSDTWALTLGGIEIGIVYFGIPECYQRTIGIDISGIFEKC